MPLPLLMIPVITAAAQVSWTVIIAGGTIEAGVVGVGAYFLFRPKRQAPENTKEIEEYMNSHTTIYTDLHEDLKQLQEKTISVTEEWQTSAVKSTEINDTIDEIEAEEQKIIDKAYAMIAELEEKITTLNTEIKDLKTKVDSSSSNPEVTKLKNLCEKLNNQLIQYKKFKPLFQKEREEKLLWKNRFSKLVGTQCSKPKNNNPTSKNHLTSFSIFEKKTSSKNNPDSTKAIEPEKNIPNNLGA